MSATRKHTAETKAIVRPAVSVFMSSSSRSGTSLRTRSGSTAQLRNNMSLRTISICLPSAIEIAALSGKVRCFDLNRVAQYVRCEGQPQAAEALSANVLVLYAKPSGLHSTVDTRRNIKHVDQRIEEVRCPQ